MKKPTVEEIELYMQEKGFHATDEAEAMHDHFESNGWMVGKNKMKCWKAATRTWMRNYKKWRKPNDTNKPTVSFADQQRSNARAATERLNAEALEHRNRASNIRAIR